MLIELINVNDIVGVGTPLKEYQSPGIFLVTLNEAQGRLSDSKTLSISSQAL